MGVATRARSDETRGMLNCVHHIQWVRELHGGLHQCLQCFQVVTRKDVYPKFEELPEDFRRRWEAHEAAREQPQAP
jgi:hypothetical protein